jgi:adenylate cyclase
LAVNRLRTWLRRTEAEGLPDSFEKELAREMLASERRRATILAGMFSCLLVIYVAAASLFPALLGRLSHGKLQPVTLIPLIAPAIVYELLARALFGYFLKTNREPPLMARYGNALIETSFPTLLIIMAARIFDPAYALLLPPVLFYFFFILLATLRLDFGLCVFTGAVAAVEYLGLAALYVGRGQTVPGDPILTALPHHLGKGIIFLLSGVLAGLVALQIKRGFIHSLRLIEERNRVVGMFGQHVSPAVVEKLLTQEVDLGGEVRHVCLMFLDIRDFTAFAEGQSPEAVVQYLNTLFDFMIETVNRYQGIVNKFLGDGFMAVFGAPILDGEDSRHAVEAALEIVAKVEALNARNGIPPTRIGIGLHAGEAVTGNVGSALRKEYTIIGDVVNLASRIEQLNKQFGSRLLISEDVRRAIGEAGPEAVALGPVEVRGYTAPVQIYKLA